MIGTLHHIGIAVASLDEAAARYRAMGFAVSPPETVEAEGVRLAFVHPRSTGGVLLELVQE